ncbi:DUF420 domain-containing protein [Oceanithermus desulfurans]|uniref:DUF420 domain-containing protein n=2 Tax=Oceanithermus desulfurans TaxID=227924 RepID=A0A511RGM9_9DEIN|nr:DUF420 domain-containing protein [Oceanithermus desulfurans]MBB6030241.1 putative membrane protein [Oceanithermus desulfurans]GEM88800.1 hypothetical protein ODE01S_02340 [Oceanithermus desulfurans NBRC 100063]
MASLGAWAAAAILASGVLVVVGVGMIRSGRRDLHPKAMLAAILLAAVFLVLYLIKWSFVGATHYGGPAWGRVPYLALLLTHTVAATLNLPLVLVAVYWALRGELARHRVWVRWAVPVWLYAALSGWLIYLVLARYGVPA